MITAFILSQILAGLAFLLDMVSFQFKKREQILLPLVFSASLISVHFFLLDQITASLIVFLSAVRMFLARKFVSEKVMMVGTTVWIIHNALVGSPGAVIVEASFLTGNIVGYYRHYMRGM